MTAIYNVTLFCDGFDADHPSGLRSNDCPTWIHTGFGNIDDARTYLAPRGWTTTRARPGSRYRQLDFCPACSAKRAATPA